MLIYIFIIHIQRDDMERAVDKLDDEEFRGRDGSSYIRVKFANKSGGWDIYKCLYIIVYLIIIVIVIIVVYNSLR